jgi:hypothetical protein
MKNAPRRYHRDYGGGLHSGGGNSNTSISSLDGTSGGMNEGLDESSSGSSGSFRPFQTLLLLRDESDVVAALPPDSSHQVCASFSFLHPYFFLLVLVCACVREEIRTLLCCTIAFCC